MTTLSERVVPNTTPTTATTPGQTEEENVGGSNKQTTDQTPWSETAWDWYQRTQSRRTITTHPTSPREAAWAFGNGTTGVGFVDQAILQQQHQDSSRNTSNHETPQPPILHLRGDSAATTASLVSLAARFVVATRPSLFPASTTNNSSVPLPRVIWLDSSWTMTIPQLVYTVRSALLRSFDGNNNSTQVTTTCFEAAMEDCLNRIQVVNFSDPSDWMVLLQLVLFQERTDQPVLVLWDGFPTSNSSESAATAAARMDMVRALHQWITNQASSCAVLLVTSSSSSSSQQHQQEGPLGGVSVRLEPQQQHASTTSSNHSHVATLRGGTQVPFSISLAGILS